MSSNNLTRHFRNVKARLEEQDAKTLTATVAGANIPGDAEFVTVTSDTATKIVNLPSAVNGKRLVIYVIATGCELRSAVAADKVNSVVVGATNEAALVFAVEYTLVYNGTTGNWVMTGKTALGAATTPVVPDAV